MFNPSAWLQVLEMALHVLTMNGIRFTADERGCPMEGGRAEVVFSVGEATGRGGMCL